MGKVRVGLFVMVAVLVMAGCVSRTGGSTAQEMLAIPTRPGDQLDPCSLTGPAAYEPAGTARMPGKPTLDECRVSVATKAGRVVIRVGYRLPVDKLPGERTVLEDMGRGVTIERVGEGCMAALVLAGDDIAITASEELGDDRVPGKDVLCELTEGAVRGVYTVFVHGRARFWTPEPGSFALLDACELLPAESVYGELGGGGQTDHYPIGHGCWWGGWQNSATLWFPVAESPADAGVPAGTASETIGGLTSWVVGGGDDCAVYTQHIEFEPGVGTYEFAAVTVRAADPCTKARAIADEAWAALPA